MNTAPLILGKGWLGNQWCERFPTSRWTQRRTLGPTFFDLRDPLSWSQLIPFWEGASKVIWTFSPCENQDEFQKLQDFTSYFKPIHNPPLWVFGTTSVWKGEGVFSERSPLSPSWRVQGENWLMEHLGASILHLSGLFGVKRSPLKWIQKGSIVTNHKVHLIHGQDVIDLMIQLKGKVAPQTRIILSSPPRLWDEISFAYQCKGLLERLNLAPVAGTQRCLQAHLLSQLIPDFSFRQPCWDESWQDLRNL